MPLDLKPPAIRHIEVLADEFGEDPAEISE